MGKDFSFGIEINSGGYRGQGHHHGNDPWAGDRFPYPRDRYPQPQPQVDPITMEAMQIARELDSGQTHRAAERLRYNLQTMPHFGMQRALVERVDAFEREGVGADLCLTRRPDRQGGIWDDIRIKPPQYYDHGRGGHYPGGYPGGYPRDGRPPIYRGQPQVDIHIDLNLFKRR